MVSPKGTKFSSIHARSWKRRDVMKRKRKKSMLTPVLVAMEQGPPGDLQGEANDEARPAMRDAVREWVALRVKVLRAAVCGEMVEAADLQPAEVEAPVI